LRQRWLPTVCTGAGVLVGANAPGAGCLQSPVSRRVARSVRSVQYLRRAPLHAIAVHTEDGVWLLLRQSTDSDDGQRTLRQRTLRTRVPWSSPFLTRIATRDAGRGLTSNADLSHTTGMIFTGAWYCRLCDRCLHVFAKLGRVAAHRCSLPIIHVLDITLYNIIRSSAKTITTTVRF